MNLWEYLAFGGLERVLLIGAAILISYWGYHLYSKAQIAGLSMIAVAALLLMSVVLTSGQHQESVNASLLASNTATVPPQPPATETIVAEVVDATQPKPAAVLAEEKLQEATAAVEGSSSSDSVNGPTADRSADESVDATDSSTTPTVAQTNATAANSEPARIERLVPLASGSELGGRIVSVRSENVTLEWSAGDSRRRIISESSKQ